MKLGEIKFGKQSVVTPNKNSMKSTKVKNHGLLKTYQKFKTKVFLQQKRMQQICGAENTSKG